MRAAVVTSLGGPDVLRVVDVPDPVPGPGQVLVRVRAACVNPADVAARVGLLPGGADTPPFLPGWDIAGEIVTCGDDAGAFQVGDRVAGMIPWFLTRGAPGGYAELVAADPDWLAPVPAGLDLVAAATVPLNGLTAHQALDLLGPGVSADSTLLITGASGGVGAFAAQLAARRGLRVLAVASHDDQEWVRGLGVHTTLPRTTDLAALGPIPAVLDAVPVGEPAIAALADGGALVATRPGPQADPARRIHQHVVMVHPDSGVLGALLRDAAAGLLHTRIAQTLPLTGAAQAHHLLEAGGLRGKVVLEP